MFKFTTTTIINTEKAVNFDGQIYVDKDGNDVPKFEGSATELFVAGSGHFTKKSIVSIYKTPFKQGVRELAKLTVPTVNKDHLLRVTVTIKLVGKTYADYSNMYQDFQKPVSTDIIATGDAAVDAANIAKALNKLSKRDGNILFSTTNTGANLTIRASNNYQRFTVDLSKVEDEYTNPKEITLAKSTIDTPGVIGFGDGDWMVQQVQIPTGENTGYFRILRTERPVFGGNYTQYILKEKVEVSGSDFLHNGDLKSITQHIFWVKSDLVEKFDTELAKVTSVIEVDGTTPIPKPVDGETEEPET